MPLVGPQISLSLIWIYPFLLLLTLFVCFVFFCILFFLFCFFQCSLPRVWTHKATSKVTRSFFFCLVYFLLNRSRHLLILKPCLKKKSFHVCDSIIQNAINFSRFTLYIPCPEGYAEPKSYCSFHINERINRVSTENAQPAVSTYWPNLKAARIIHAKILSRPHSPPGFAACAHGSVVQTESFSNGYGNDNASKQ